MPMSVLDILEQKAQELSSPSSESGIPVQADAPVIKRLSEVVDFVTKTALTSEDTSAKARFMITKLTEEFLAELRDLNPEMVEYQFKAVTAMMHWVSTGEVAVEAEYPPGFKAAVLGLDIHAVPELEAAP